MAITRRTIPARVKLLGSGYEALPGPFDVEDADKVYEVTLLLSKEGLDELLELVPLHLLEEQRLNWIYAQRDGNLNPTEDDILANAGAREVYQELLANRKLAGGSILYPDDHTCPDIDIITVEAAGELLDDDGNPLCGLPTDEQDQLNRWLIANIGLDKLFAALQRLKEMHPDFFSSSSGGSTYGGSGGNAPGTGDGSNTGGTGGGSDTGTGNAEWDTSGSGFKKICFDPPVLLDGPHPEDAITNLNPSTQIIPTNHSVNVTQHVKDVFHNAFGFFGKLFRFKAADFSFDGLTVDSVHYLFPVDVTIPVLFPVDPQIVYNDAGGTERHVTIDPTGGPFTGLVKVKIDGVETDFEEINVHEYSEALGVAGNHTATPNSGTYIRCNDIHLAYSQATPPFYAQFDPADIATDHNGLRWFLECIYCQDPTAYEVTMPVTCEAAVNAYDRMTAGYSAAYLHNGMDGDGGIENSTGTPAWYPPIGGCNHGQVFLPEEATATSIEIDIDITNPTGVSDADWNVFVRNDSGYDGTGGTLIASAVTQHNSTSGSGGRHTVHLTIPLGATYNCCTPFDIQVVGGVLVYKITVDYA